VERCRGSCQRSATASGSPTGVQSDAPEPPGRRRAPVHGRDGLAGAWMPDIRPTPSASSISRLRACCATHAPTGCGVTPSAGQVQRQPEASGQVVGGAQRQHPQGGVAVGQAAGGSGQAAVAAAEHQQVRGAGKRLGEGVVQPGWVVDGEAGVDPHASGVQARPQPRVESAPFRERVLTTSTVRPPAWMAAVSAALERNGRSPPAGPAPPGLSPRGQASRRAQAPIVVAHPRQRGAVAPTDGLQLCQLMG
jgi:hypothetical protein